MSVDSQNTCMEKRQEGYREGKEPARWHSDIEGAIRELWPNLSGTYEFGSLGKTQTGFEVFIQLRELWILGILDGGL